jgi:hypothetical protein
MELPGEMPRRWSASSREGRRPGWRWHAGAETKQSLQDTQATVASGIARAINSRKRPSAKQAAEGERVLQEARKKGFRAAGIQSV